MEASKFFEHVSEPKGAFRLEAVGKGGERKVLVDINNLIVKNFATQCSYLLAGDGLNDRYINRIGYGVGTSEPSVDDYELTRYVPYGEEEGEPYIAVATVDDVQFPTTYSVRFRATVEAPDFNGVEWSEAGLMTANTSPYLMSRVTFPPQMKSEYWSWTAAWTIYWIPA